MPVNILYGRAASGKSHACTRQISDMLKNRGGDARPMILIVPEQFSYAAERALTDAFGAIGTATAEVLTFSRLAYRIFAKHSSGLKKALSPAGKNMLVYKALYKQKSKLSLFSGSSEKAGFIDKIAGLISELKRYGVGPEQLRERSQTADNMLLRQKLSDLSLVYEYYDTLVLDGYTDAEESLYFAAALLAQESFLDGAHIWIDEFSDFLPQHYAMLEALAGKASDITICLCCDRERDEEGFFAPAARTFHELQKLCIRCGVNMTSQYMEGGHITSAELAHLERAYTDYSAPAYRGGKTRDIGLFEAKNVFSEVERCARHILSLVRDEGCRFRDIAVAVGNMDVYAEYAQAVFAQHEIPCFVSEKPAASTHPLVLVLETAFELFVKNWSYESIFAYLKTGFSGIPAQDIDLLENYVLAAGISGKRWYQEEKWQYKAGLFDDAGQDRLRLDEIDAIRRRVIAPLMALREGVGGRKTVKESCRAVFAFMVQLELYQQTQAKVEKLKEAGALSLANQYSRIWNIIIQVLDQMVLIAGEDKMGMEAFKNMMATGFSKHQSGIIPQSVDQVLLCDIPNSRACNSKVLFILGANSGYFPSASASEGILSDADREALAESDLTLAPTARQKAIDERFLVYKALTKPTEKLQISYAISNAEGEALLPSQVIGTLRKIFPQITITDDLIDDPATQAEIELIASRIGTFNLLGTRMRGRQSHSIWQDVLAWYENDPRFSERVAGVRRALRHSNAAGDIPADTLSLLYSGDLYSSVSRLEEFRKCPYSHFVKYMLKAKERKILQMGAPDIGKLLHAVMEQFTERVLLSGSGWHALEDRWCTETVDDIVEGMMIRMFHHSTLSGKGTTFLIRRLKDNLVRYVTVMVGHIRRGRFEPVGGEVRFGEGEQIRAEIPLGGQRTLKINGRIDRVDALSTPEGTYYRVIDYKSGSKTFSLDNIYHSLDLQLMVYLDAAVSQSADGIPAGMLYYRITEPSVRLSGPLKQNASLETELNNQLKLDGLVLADHAVLENMDCELDGRSDMLPVTLLKDGGFHKNSSVATLKQFELLSGYMRDSLRRIGREILRGRIEIRPCRQGDWAACAFCGFGGICKFTPLDKNGYDDVKKINAEGVWEQLRQRVQGEGGTDRGN